MRSSSIVMVSLALCLIPGCAFQMGITNEGAAVLMSAGDVRIGWKSSKAADVELEASKEAMSENAKELAKEVAEEAIPIIVKGVLKGVVPTP